MSESTALWNIETPSEELERLERELIEMELERGFDFHAVEPITLDDHRAQIIADFNQPKSNSDNCDWFGYDADSVSETEFVTTH